MATKKKAEKGSEEGTKAAKKAANSEVSAESAADATAAKRQTDSASATSKAASEPASTEQSATPSAADSSSTGAQKSDGEISELDGVALPAARGKAGVLGGPKDRGIKSDDKLALPAGKFFTYERVLSLNPKSFYCAMRWDYRVLGKSPEEGKRWWANKRLLVTNPANGQQVIVRAVDYGPHESTGLTISLSPGALEALGVEIGDDVEIAFADQKAPLGLIGQ